MLYSEVFSVLSFSVIDSCTEESVLLSVDSLFDVVGS